MLITIHCYRRWEFKNCARIFTLNEAPGSSTAADSRKRASHYFSALLRYSLAVVLKRLGQAARGVQRAVHCVEQRQIAQQGTAVNLVLSKRIGKNNEGGL
jgi:hypothetical protein